VNAFKTWKDTPVMTRQRYLFDLHSLIRKHENEFINHMTREHGKTKMDAKGDLTRGLEVLEHACSMSSLTMGETSMNVSKGIDTYSFKVPLGVCGGVAPFNFPAMIPLWMFPISIACGNTFILKPSERAPSTSMLMCELM
jgi:malonate-semialdehyde dehydrogenase (acetylating)/methylmalonate-semialdehyde dehydrogenase